MGPTHDRGHSFRVPAVAGHHLGKNKPAGVFLGRFVSGIIAATHPPENLQARRNVARAMFGPLEFSAEEQAELPCPAAHLHGTPDNRQARLYLRGAPTMHCFHDSCRGELETLNTQLRREIAKAERAAFQGGCGNLATKRFDSNHLVATPPPRGPSPEETLRKKQKALGPAVLKQALERFPVELPDLWELSPYRLELEPVEQFPLFMRTLWRPHEIVWCGYNPQSGQERHRDNFKPAAVWAEVGRPPGPQTSGFSFKPGTCSRKKEFIEARRHLVVESDTLTKEQAASLFLWLKERMRLPLRAVVHSGNKSLHGWFGVPGEERLRELQEVLPVAGVDGKVLKTSGIPVRVPGWKREETGLWQRLLYLDRAACDL